MRLIMKKVDGEEDGGDYIEVGILHVHFQLAKILSTKVQQTQGKRESESETFVPRVSKKSLVVGPFFNLFFSDVALFILLFGKQQNLDKVYIFSKLTTTRF